jgi:hypothetical protein
MDVDLMRINNLTLRSKGRSAMKPRSPHLSLNVIPHKMQHENFETFNIDRCDHLGFTGARIGHHQQGVGCYRRPEYDQLAGCADLRLTTAGNR